MLLTITTTHQPATDLGHLLRKNPSRAQTFELSFGQAHVFYPEATVERCTVALLLEVDSVDLVRGRRRAGGEAPALEQYVNDRPYVASSFLSVALSNVFGTALSRISKDRPELVDVPLPFTAQLPVLPCRGGERFLRLLFEPLGYAVTVAGHPLDEVFPAWGESPYFSVTLSGVVPLHRLLSHLYVLVPVLDGDKHYWVGDEEVEKLLRHAEGWLSTHPERESITRRYLKHQRSLVADALARLSEGDSDPAGREEKADAEEERIEAPLSLQEQRLAAVLDALRSVEARRVLDLGCGSGQLLRGILADRRFDFVLGMDVSHRALEVAHERLHLDRMPPRQRERIQLLHGSLMYRDQRLCGFDAAAVVEVIEHLDPPRLAAFERVLFEFAAPAAIVLTTPNAEYNVQWETLPAGDFRHRDHRFEWTRAELQAWANTIARRHGYGVRFLPVGPEDPDVGSPTQLALFTKAAAPAPRSALEESAR